LSQKGKKSLDRFWYFNIAKRKEQSMTFVYGVGKKVVRRAVVVKVALVGRKTFDQFMAALRRSRVSKNLVSPSVIRYRDGAFRVTLHVAEAAESTLAASLKRGSLKPWTKKIKTKKVIRK
jgi:hypothetical protein